MKERRSRKTETRVDKRNKKDNLPGAQNRDPMLTRHLPLSKGFILDQAQSHQLLQLPFLGSWSRPVLHCSLHGNEILILDHIEGLLVLLNNFLALTSRSEVLPLSHKMEENDRGERFDGGAQEQRARVSAN